MTWVQSIGGVVFFVNGQLSNHDDSSPFGSLFPIDEFYPSNSEHDDTYHLSKALFLENLSYMIGKYLASYNN